MTRALQDRLALANVKIQHGWQNRSINSLETELAKDTKRKRSSSGADAFSDSSSISGRYSSTDLPSSSPLTAPLFSDDILRSGSSRGYTKRFMMLPPTERPASATHIRPQRLVNRSKNSWKAAYRLPMSSPIKRIPEMHDVPFQRDSTVLDSPSASEDDDQDLPTSSYRQSSIQIRSSPPCTPPPSMSRRSRRLGSPVHDTQGGKEGADLLLYLAASPSPAMRMSRTEMYPPSTPPSKHTPLPSSMMSTPGGQYLPGFAPTTPSTAFNFADFVNITPSPAQGAWPKTPGKTPLLALEARRRLTFDSPTLQPHPSPNIGTITRSSTRKAAGLGMELGGELVP
jgi:hypothetical protein